MEQVAAATSVWDAPAIFGLGDRSDRKMLLSAISLLRHKIGNLAEPVTLDFSKTEKLFADGVLLFLAELRRLIKYTKGTVEISINLPHNKKVLQVLKQVGILDLLNVKKTVVPEDHDVINWRSATGNLVLGEKYDDILKEYDGDITESLQSGLYTGITEAMTNVLNHAYDVLREDGLNVQDQKTWWMFSHEKDGFLTVVFCDLGGGIPRTLPTKRRSVWNRLIRKGITGDAEIIKFAVKDSVSRTKKDHRGKGLRQIVQVTKGLTGGEVAIYSNHGVLLMRPNEISQCIDYRDSILGTLILWKIPLVAKEVV